jgi:hypothetical protein
MMALKSMLRVKKTRDAGRRYREAMKYKPDSSPEIKPSEFRIEGKK